MLLKLFVLFYFTSTVLSQYGFNPALPGLLLSEEEITERSKFNDSESVVTPSPKPTTCPANEFLIQMKNILTKLLNSEDDNTYTDILKVKDIPHDNVFPLNIENGIENLVLPLSKQKPLRQLLENNNLNSNFKTKITVQYELPNNADSNCNQILSTILQVLRTPNLMHESSRSCGPYDINCLKDNVLDMKNIGNQHVFTTNINQGIIPNISPPTHNSQKSSDSNRLFGSGQDLNAILKYSALNQRNHDLDKSTFKNYRSKNQSTLNDIKIRNEMPKPIEKLTQVLNADGNTEFIQNKQINYPGKSAPYQLHITESIVSPTNLNEINHQNLNISETLLENSIQSKIQVPFEKPRNQVLGVNEKPDDVLVAVTNDGKITSVYPTNPKWNGNAENNFVNDKILSDYANELQNKVSIASDVKNLFNRYLQGNVNNLPRDKINALLAVFKTGGYESQYNQFPQETTINENHNLKPYNINPQVLISNFKPYPVVPNSSIRQFPYKESRNDQLHANLNVFDQISNQENLLTHQNSASQMPYVNENPYIINSKLVDYGKHVNQLHAPYNPDNLQRLVSENNQVKFNFTPDNSGVVELTYLLKQPNPVVYQPVYFVKYRLPYDSFVKNLRDLVRTQPQLRSNRAKLYQELLTLSKVAEVSPNLKGLGQQKLLQMVANNGALVKTKVLKVNETLLDKQFKTIQDLNSNLAPKELGDSKFALLNKEAQEIVLNKTKIEELKELEKAKFISSNFSHRDIFGSYKTVTNKFNGISTDNYPTSIKSAMYPLV